MAITGLCMVGFLLMHMFGNFKLLLGDHGAEFNEYSEYLRRFLYPVMPPTWFLRAFEAFLTLCVVLHMYSAAKLTGRKWRTAGRNRYVTKKNMEQSYSARTMIWGGIIIVLFVVFHLLEFTAQRITIGYSGKTDPFDRTVLAFQHWWVVVVYAVAMGAVCMHVWHGFYSAFTTLGASVGPSARMVFKVCSWAVSLLIFVGFMLAPVCILAGLVK